MFKEKETLLQNIAFMGLMAALNVLLSVLGTFVPIAGIFVLIFLPFFSAVVAMLCKWKYYPIYAFATLGVALCTTFWYTAEFTIFYLAPSLITGFLFGLCFKRQLSGTYSLLFTSIAQFGLTYIALLIINGIYDVDLIQTFLKLFKLDGNNTASIIVPSFIYLLSLAQMLLSYIVLQNEIKKFTDDRVRESGALVKIVGLVIALSVIPFAFNYVDVSYLLMFISLFVTTSVLVEIIFTKNKLNIILSSIFFVLGFLLVFMLYQVVKMPHAFLLINTSNILVLTYSLLYNLKRDKPLC